MRLSACQINGQAHLSCADCGILERSVSWPSEEASKFNNYVTGKVLFYNKLLHNNII